MSSSLRIDMDIPMKMRDGVVLRSNIIRLDDSQKHPAILLRTPYDKNLSTQGRGGDFLSNVAAALDGYAVVIQDIRGRFASDGEYTRLTETVDGYDTVESIAVEPWCDGNVGMAGASYLAHNQWAAAIGNPPSLKAIAPAISAQGAFEEVTHTGGAIHLDLAANLVTMFCADIMDRMEKQGEDVSEMRSMIHRAMFNPGEVYNFLPLKEIPLLKLKNLPAHYRDYLTRSIPTPDIWEYAIWHYDKVNVPCFHSGGWYDTYTGSLFKNFLRMREKGGTPLARQGQYLMCGPWAHDSRLPAFVGDIHFGPVASGHASQLSQAHLDFFDRYLRGREVELSAIQYFVMSENIWHSADTWPLPQTQWQRFFLHSKGHANTDLGDGLLSRDEPGSQRPDIFVYNPHFPVPTTGGRNLSILPSGSLIPGPIDQSRIEQRHDVLCYTTQELDEDIEVTGPLTLNLFASTSAKDTDFTVKLVDVYPDGRAYNVAEGIIRARYRKSILEPELVCPGEVNEYCIDMAASSNLFRKGHRIRVDISSSNFPRFDRNMNTGNDIGVDAQGIPAMQSIFHQSEYPSYIDLPVIRSSSS